MSITRKEVLTNKYEELKSKLLLYVNKDMFPSLSNLDIVDVISFIKLYFPRDSDYNQTIKGLMEQNEIVVNDNDFWIVSSLIIAFIENINNI